MHIPLPLRKGRKRDIAINGEVRKTLALKKACRNLGYFAHVGEKDKGIAG